MKNEFHQMKFLILSGIFVFIWQNLQQFRHQIHIVVMKKFEISDLD